jgi:hypothetical protein
MPAQGMNKKRWSESPQTKSLHAGFLSIKLLSTPAAEATDTALAANNPLS